MSYTRSFSPILFGVLLLSACSSFESHDARREGLDLDVPPETVIDLTVQPQDPGDFFEQKIDVSQPQPEWQVKPSMQTEGGNPFWQTVGPEYSEYRSVYPTVKGYKVNKNVEVFLFDDLDKDTRDPFAYRPVELLK